MIRDGMKEAKKEISNPRNHENMEPLNYSIFICLVEVKEIHRYVRVRDKCVQSWGSRFTTELITVTLHFFENPAFYSILVLTQIIIAGVIYAAMRQRGDSTGKKQ